MVFSRNSKRIRETENEFIVNSRDTMGVLTESAMDREWKHDDFAKKELIHSEFAKNIVNS